MSDIPPRGSLPSPSNPALKRSNTLSSHRGVVNQAPSSPIANSNSPTVVPSPISSPQITNPNLSALSANPNHLYTKHKKLKDFYDTKADQKTKFKSLNIFCETSNHEDIKQFFEFESFGIWKVFLDTFAFFEQQKASPKKDKGIQKLLQILKRILIYLPMKIREKWQYRSITNILGNILLTQNKHEIRTVGLELALLFLEDLGISDPKHAGLIQLAVDLEPFKNGYEVTVNLPPPMIKIDNQNPLSPSTLPYKIENATGLLDIYLEFVGNNTRCNEFSLHWEILKTNYITLWYPDVCRKIGLVEKNSELGFPEHCPYEIQDIFITKLRQWMSKPELIELLWSTSENEAIMLEIYRQSCLLPIQHVGAMRISLYIFSSMFMGTEKDPIPKILASKKEKLLEYQRYYIEQFRNILNAQSKPPYQEAQGTLCIEVLDLARKAFIAVTNSKSGVSVEIRNALLFTLLEISTDLLRPDHPNPELAKGLAPNIIDTLLYIWITSRLTDEEMWIRLQEGLYRLFHRKEAIIQTKLKLVQLSCLIRDFIFTKKSDQILKENIRKSITPDYKKRTKIEPDQTISSLPWDYQTLHVIWNHLLQVFGLSNRIKNAELHREAMITIQEVAEIFIFAEEEAPYESLIRSSPKPFCLLNIFGQWLLEACNLEDQFREGKAVAFRVLLDLLTRYYFIPPATYPRAILPYVFTTIHWTLVNHDSDFVSWSIIEHSSNLFNLGLPGATILAPYYLFEIKRLLLQKKYPSDFSLRKVLTILASLIGLSGHFGDLEIPTVFYGHWQKQEAKDFLKCNTLQLREHVFDILMMLLTKFDQISHLHPFILNCIAVITFESFTNNPTKTLGLDTLQVLLNNTTNKNESLALTSLDCILSLTVIKDDLPNLDKTLIPTIINGVIQNTSVLIDELKHNKNETREKIACQHLFVLTDWILNAPDVLDEVFIRTIFTLLEKCINSIPVTDYSANKGSLRNTGSFRALSPEQTTGVTSSKHSVFEAGQLLLSHLLIFHKSFPSVRGFEIFSCQLLEKDDTENDPTHQDYYLLNGTNIVSYQEIKGNDKFNHARLFLRNANGKFVWDFDFLPNSPNAKTEFDSLVNLFSNDLGPTNPRPKPQPPTSANVVRQKGSIEIWDHEVGSIPQVDRIDQLLQYLSEKYPDCGEGFKDGKINQPTLLPVQYLSQIVTTQKDYVQQQQNDAVFINQQKHKTTIALQTTPPPPVTPIHKYQNCKLLLTQLGFLNSEGLQSDIQTIDNTTQFQLKLKNLDKTNNREILKIGLIYVKNGQDSQKDILSNEGEGSDLYKEFVASLGYSAQISTHKGYSGGLALDGSNGTELPYYSNPTLEVAFHEICKMPTDPKDPQQLLKKRHVGNDSVHIIWSDHPISYSTRTITSQFNDAHICIYPLPNGLFRIEIAQKEGVPAFGPLLHGMVVSKKLLAPLVRRTAISAYRFIRYNTEGYDRPYFTRQNLINEIAIKSASDNTSSYLPTLLSEEKPALKEGVLSPPMNRKKITQETSGSSSVLSNANSNTNTGNSGGISSGSSNSQGPTKVSNSGIANLGGNQHAKSNWPSMRSQTSSGLNNPTGNRPSSTSQLLANKNNPPPSSSTTSALPNQKTNLSDKKKGIGAILKGFGKDKEKN